MAKSTLTLGFETDYAFNCDDCGRPGVVRLKTKRSEKIGGCCFRCFVKRLEKRTPTKDAISVTVKLEEMRHD